MSRKSRIVLRTAATACAIGAAAALGLALASASDPFAAASTVDRASTLRTPVWSPRRVPLVFGPAAARAEQARAAAADAALTTRLQSIVAPYAACAAVDIDGRAVARVGGNQALAPASTLKLLTAATALETLGPDRRFRTRALLDDAGNLVVVGGGDPMLATPTFVAHRNAQPRFRNAVFTPLGALADAIAAAGIHRVTGALVVDDHLHDSRRALPDWKPNYVEDGEVGSLGALTVDGGWSDPIAQTAAPDPALLTGQRLRDALAARGVTITGAIRRGVAPADAREIAHVDSPPLSNIVGEMLRGSDNYTAEELVRDIAAGTSGGNGATTYAGTQIVAATLGRLGVPTDGLELHDGSGLAPDDRVGCPTLLGVINRSTAAPLTAIDAGLPVAGRSGTLAEAFGGTPLAGRLRAKTGSIDGVVGLTGVVDGSVRPTFAFLANGRLSESTGVALQAAIAAAVAAYPDTRQPQLVVPRP